MRTDGVGLGVGVGVAVAVALEVALGADEGLPEALAGALGGAAADPCSCPAAHPVSSRASAAGTRAARTFTDLLRTSGSVPTVAAQQARVLPSGMLVGVDGAAGDVDVREAARAAEAGEVLLLDVREHEEWAAGRAPTAVHVPMGELRQDTVPRDRPVLVLCRVGGRSAAVAQALGQLGYDVANVTGGMLTWSAAGLPVVRDGDLPGTVL